MLFSVSPMLISLLQQPRWQALGQGMFTQGRRLTKLSFGRGGQVKVLFVCVGFFSFSYWC